MATIKNNWLSAISILTIFLGIFFVAKAMEKKTDVNTVATTTWHFTGNDPSEIMNPANWEEGASPENCETELTLELPCTFETNVNIVDSEALIDYFETQYPSDTAEQVTENAVSTRNPE